LPLQEAAYTIRWAYVWLAAGGLLLVPAVLSLGYLLIRRRWAEVIRMVRHPALIRADRWLARRFPRFRAFIRQRFAVRHWYGLAFTAAAVIIMAATYLFVEIAESWTDEEAL
jgi:hypothetical protein